MNAPHKPLVVIAATSQSDKEQTAKEVTEIARKWRDRKEQAPVVFTWMDADRWGSWLKSMYGLKADSGPRAIVANHSVSDWRRYTPDVSVYRDTDGCHERHRCWCTTTRIHSGRRSS